MSDVLTVHQALVELADAWDQGADALDSLDPDDRAAKGMRRCAEDLRQVAQVHAPQWVTHATVKARTGWSDSYLYKRYRKLEEHQKRKERGSWFVTLDAARSIPVKRSHDPLPEGATIDELADYYVQLGTVGR